MLRGTIETLMVVSTVMIAVCWAFCLMAALRRSMKRLFVGTSVWKLQRTTLAVLLAVAATVTIIAQKDRTGGTGTTGVPSVGEQQTGTTGVPPVASGLTNTLHFASIDVHSNGTATLTIAWPRELIPTNTTIDVLAATSLVNSAWIWQCGHTVAEGETNWNVTVVLPETVPGTNAPSAFYRALHRETCADTMDDLDGDGIPGAYEIRRGGNLYVADYEYIEKLTVGQFGDFQMIEDAVAGSEPYDIIVLDPLMRHEIGESWSGLGCELPSYPVMITSPEPYAVVRSTRWSAFLFASGGTSRTIFRNLYVLLARPDDFQCGFWCGGNLPWEGIPAAATFDNVYVRMPNPGVRYRAWNFHRSCADVASIGGCTVNAAGATWAVGIYAYGSPTLAVDRCSLVNFPPMLKDQDGRSLGEGVWAILVSESMGDGGSSVSISRTVFDESFTNALALYRMETERPYALAVTDSIIPKPFTNHVPDVEANLAVTDAALTWSGIPRLDSPSVALGIGSLMPIANDPSTHSDDDGICDYEEVYGRGLDPFNADTDNDGVSDNQEISAGTDPADPHSFKQTLTVTVTNRASSAHAVYTAWGVSGAGWEANGLAAFPEGFGTTNYFGASSQGATHIKAFCDLNGNGVFDADHDILLVREIPPVSTAHVTFTFGDVDGDGVPDAQERQDQTDPYDANNFRLSAKFKFTDHDAGHGCVNFVAVSLTETEWDPAEVVMVSADGTFDYTVNTNVIHGAVYVKCLHDRDGDGLLDVGSEGITTNRLSRSVDLGKPIEVSIGDFDYDGVCDTQEMLEGTDPFDGNNYLMRTRIDIAVSDDGCGVTNLVSVSEANDDWQPASVVTSFVGYAATHATNGILTTGALQVRCIRDFDRDGEFGTSGDIVYRTSVGHSWNGKRFHFTVGDCDGDGIPDSVEKAEGTDPKGATNYCFNLSATVTSIFAPTNRLTAIAYFGNESNLLYGPSVQTGSALSVDFGHLTTASREKVKFLFWDGIDGNGVRNTGERRTVCEFPVIGHDMCVTNSLGLGDFDADGDGMLDDWERQHGLSPTNAADATLDADADGFINLYEYWAGTDPNNLIEDGSGTALVAGSCSVDDRIADKQPTLATSYYNGFGSGAYPTNTPLTNIVFTLNTDCWMYGVDLSCMSIWSDQSHDWSTEPLTLISPLHVMCASHVTPANGTRVVFRSLAEDLFVRTLVDSKPIFGVAADDLCIGILDEPLPSDIKIARFLAPGYSSYIGTGRKLPYVRIGREKQCTIEDVVFLSPTSKQSRMIKIEHPFDHLRYQYIRGAIMMDSGHPIFFLFGNELAFLCPTRGFYRDETGALGFLCSVYLGRIQDFMNFLSDTRGLPRETLQTYNFDAYERLENAGGLE